MERAYADARSTLDELASDRGALAERLLAPWWSYPLLALLAAAFVATPAIGHDLANRLSVGCLLAAFVLLVGGYHRLSGVRVGRVGLRGGVILAALVMAILVLLSVANGLAASLSDWWVTVPAVAAFAVVVLGGRYFDRVYRQGLRRGH